MVSATKAYADEPLRQHIAKHCKVDCVDAALFKMAVQEAATEKHVDPMIMTAIIQVESGFKVKATNRNNGISAGLTQVQVGWHKKKFKSVNYYDVFDNVMVGAGIYRDCAERHAFNRKKALWCYNGHQKTGMAKYVPKVLRAHQELINNGVYI
jgi:soluble lytic murein transglycosylase-like protein